MLLFTDQFGDADWIPTFDMAFIYKADRERIFDGTCTLLPVP